jgi:hypothetical protein
MQTIYHISCFIISYIPYKYYINANCYGPILYLFLLVRVLFIARVIIYLGGNYTHQDQRPGLMITSFTLVKRKMEDSVNWYLPGRFQDHICTADILFCSILQVHYMKKQNFLILVLYRRIQMIHLSVFLSRKRKFITNATNCGNSMDLQKTFCCN